VLTRPKPALAAVLLAAPLTALGCGGGDNGGQDQSATAQASIDKSKFTTKVDHPLVPLQSVPFTLFKGTDTGSKSVSTNRLLPKRAVVAGVPVAVVENKDYEDGKLVEHTFDYFAEHRDGSVWYFGERVENIEDGKVSHEGQWLAGKGNARPGIYMPAKPRVGQVFQQERAPGVAEDRSTVLAKRLTQKTPAGTFRNCIKVRDYSPIDKLNEFKWYCAGVGLVAEREPHARLDLVRYTRRG
jgi:hypothetical protein